MKYTLTQLFVGAALCATMLAQDNSPKSTDPNPATPPPATAQTTASQAPGGNTLKIAPGSVIPVQLAKSIDAKKAKTGDEVLATVTQDMKTNSGQVLVPKDTKVIGHVTEAQARSKEQKESDLGIAFDHAVVKGSEMQLPLSVQAVIAPPSHDTAPPGGDETAPMPSAQNSPMSGGRSGGGMGGSAPQPQQPNYPQNNSGYDPAQPKSRPEITGNTEGVIGMPNVQLEAGAQNLGSVLSSDKNNVKIEKGTMMLLKVQ